MFKNERIDFVRPFVLFGIIYGLVVGAAFWTEVEPDIGNIWAVLSVVLTPVLTYWVSLGMRDQPARKRIRRILLGGVINGAIIGTIPYPILGNLVGAIIGACLSLPALPMLILLAECGDELEVQPERSALRRVVTRNIWRTLAFAALLLIGLSCAFPLNRGFARFALCAIGLGATLLLGRDFAWARRAAGLARLDWEPSQSDTPATYSIGRGDHFALVETASAPYREQVSVRAVAHGDPNELRERTRRGLIWDGLLIAATCTVACMLFS
jgi:hypothetical protein